MSTCKECGHWEHVHTMRGETYTICLAPKFVGASDEIGGADFAICASADDDSGLHVFLRTGPDFQCSRFEFPVETQKLLEDIQEERSKLLNDKATGKPVDISRFMDIAKMLCSKSRELERIVWLEMRQLGKRGVEVPLINP